MCSTELPRKQSLCSVKNKINYYQQKLSGCSRVRGTGEKRSEIIHISFVLELSRHIHCRLPEASGHGLWDLWLVPHCHWGTNWGIIWALQPHQVKQSCRAALPALILVSEQPAAVSCKSLGQVAAKTSLSFGNAGSVLAFVCPPQRCTVFHTHRIKLLVAKSKNRGGVYVCCTNGVGVNLNSLLNFIPLVQERIMHLLCWKCRNWETWLLSYTKTPLQPAVFKHSSSW